MPQRTIKPHHGRNTCWRTTKYLLIGVTAAISWIGAYKGAQVIFPSIVDTPDVLISLSVLTLICTALVASVLQFIEDWMARPSYESLIADHEQAQKILNDDIDLLIETLIDQHITELSLKRSQKQYIGDYGIIEETKWLREIDIFYKKIIEPHLIQKYSLIRQFPVDKLRNLVNIKIDAYLQTDIDSGNPIIIDTSISPLVFEQECAAALRRLGWEARTTKASGDQGVDIIATKHTTKIVLQCKLQSTPVGNAAVQQIIAGRIYEDAAHAVVVSNAQYTASAKALAEKARVHLLHYSQLQDIDAYLTA